MEHSLIDQAVVKSTGQRGQPGRGDQNGSALLASALWLAVAAIALLLIVHSGNRVLLRSQVQAAADAAALAGAADGKGAAEAFATANGARLVTYLQTESTGGQSVSVVVEINGVKAAASAEMRLVPGVSRTSG